MELKKIQSLISSNQEKVNEIQTAKRYYNNKTDILEKGVKVKSTVRTADNRIPHNFHQTLVDEKVAYMFTYKVLISLDDEELTKKVMNVLGDRYSKVIKSLGIEASNAGTAWLHYWIDDKGNFKYASVPSEQILSIQKNSLIEDEYQSIIRYYVNIETEDGKDVNYGYIEYWTDTEFIIYKLKDTYLSNIVIDKQIIEHTLNDIPFIPFFNNHTKTSDLHKYKKLIDLYDTVTSGFANDLEDIQQIIFILKGYGGEAEYETVIDEDGDEVLKEGNQMDSFLENLKKYKTIPLDAEGNGSFDTLQIEIPTEARKVLLEQLKKQIIEFGQGLQQDTDNFGNASGTALKFFYRRLEMKAGLLETEFTSSINELVRRIILVVYGIDYEDAINQTWTRNIISNDLETAQIVQISAGILPKKLLLRYHPLVDDVDEAIALLEEEEALMEGYQEPITGDGIVE